MKKIYSSFILLAVVSAISAQNLTCVYTVSPQGDYVCLMTHANFAGEEVTQIFGTHLAGRGDEDVTRLITSYGTTRNVPAIICRSFFNLVHLDLSFSGINQITETSFAGCTLLEELILWENRIPFLPEATFANNERLRLLDLDYNGLKTLPENIFVNTPNLEILILQNNLFDLIPGGLFRPLINLQSLYLDDCNITTLNPEWFLTLGNLRSLVIYWNLFREISEEVFAPLVSLEILDIGVNELDFVHGNAFRSLTNLRLLLMDGCRVGTLNPDWFVTLTNLWALNLEINDLTAFPYGILVNQQQLEFLNLDHNIFDVIEDDAFAYLSSLRDLYLDDTGIRELNPRWFAALDLEKLYLGNNDIEEVPRGIFAHFTNLTEIGFWMNQIKTINREVFGDLSNVWYFDLGQNVVNAFDRRIIDDATSLDRLYFNNNLCASNNYWNFQTYRVLILNEMQRCFTNFEFIVETTTEGEADYRFFRGRNPGIALRVNAPENVHIALTPFDFVSNPMIEIFIGIANNTRSAIRRNQAATDVVNIETPNIITDGRWNGFRVTWANFVILVFREGEEFPFMAYTMEDIYPVNHFGIRVPEARGVWSIQPLE